MKCNGCWADVEAKTQCVATHCGHLFCMSQPLSSQDVKACMTVAGLPLMICEACKAHAIILANLLQV